MKTILYTIDCPQCKVLETAVKEAGLEYEVCKDLETMRQLGITVVPVLSVDGTLMKFPEAFQWVKKGR